MDEQAHFSPSPRLTYSVGGLLVLSGLFHVVVWAIAGGSWDGDVSWRKPILFGVSAGATTISLGWVASKLSPRFGDHYLLTAFSIAMLLEVSLITMQQWRGVASHFNRATSFDASVLSWIEGLILFATIVIIDLSARSLRELSAPPDMKLAIRGGMGLLLFACLFGFVMVGYGNHQVSLGREPGIYGAAGVMKFPHGMPIHAIQYLPFVAWCLRQLDTVESLRLRAVKYVLISVVSFTVFSLAQTFGGRARFDIGLWTGCLLALSAGLLVLPAWITVKQLMGVGGEV